LTGKSCSTENPARPAQRANWGRSGISPSPPARARADREQRHHHARPAPPALRLLLDDPRRRARRRPRRGRVQRLAQDHRRPRRHDVVARARRIARLVGLGGVELEQPAAALLLGRQLEADRLVVRVHQHQQPVVDQALPLLVDHRDRVAAQRERQRRDPRLLPVVRRHLVAVGPQPGEILRLPTPR
jgi:hypothetical protein